jgi:hypothetical protein
MRLIRWRLKAAVALLALAPAACQWPLAPPNPNSVAGRVRVELILSDVTGAPIGVRTLDQADGVHVTLAGAGAGRADSTRTLAGAYEFAHLAAGDWSVRVGVGGVATDVTYLGLGPKDHLVIRDTLVLGRSGDLVAFPNPFPLQTTIHFGLSADTRVRLQVVDLAGNLKRVLADRTFVAGAHLFTWDGANDAGKPLPDGNYAIVLLAGTDRRAEIVAKEP